MTSENNWPCNIEDILLWPLRIALSLSAPLAVSSMHGQMDIIHTCTVHNAHTVLWAQEEFARNPKKCIYSIHLAENRTGLLTKIAASLCCAVGMYTFVQYILAQNSWSQVKNCVLDKTRKLGTEKVKKLTLQRCRHHLIWSWKLKC